MLMRTLPFNSYKSYDIKLNIQYAPQPLRDIFTFTVTSTAQSQSRALRRPAESDSSRLGLVWYLIGPSYSTCSTYIRQTYFAPDQTVDWFNKLSIDSKSLGLSVPGLCCLPLLAAALNFPSYLWWQTMHLKGEAFYTQDLWAYDRAH